MSEFFKKIYAFEYEEPPVEKFFRKLFQAMSEQPMGSVGGIPIPGMPLNLKASKFLGKFHVIANNYTKEDFIIKFGEGGENDGDFDLVDGQTKEISKKSKNNKFDIQWKIREPHHNDNASAQINISYNDEWQGWRDFGDLRVVHVYKIEDLNDKGIGYRLEIRPQSGDKEDTYNYKINNQISVEIFFPSINTVQINISKD